MEYFLSPIDCFPYCGCEPFIPWLYVRQPVAVLSSFAYFFVAFLLARIGKGQGVNLKSWPLLLCIVGTTSILAHSNFTKISMAMDFASITFLVTYFPVLEILQKFKDKLPLPFTLPFYYILLVLALMPFTLLGQFFFALVMVLIGIRYFILERGISMIFERKVLLSLSILAVSVVFMFLDKKDFFCELKYVPYGHTIWHFGSALSIYLFGYWYFFNREEEETRG